jgi:hypothetical protein
VWLAWTEDPADEFANELRARKARTLRAVENVARRLRGVHDAGARRTAERLTALLDFHGELGLDAALGATGRITTTKAMEWVKARATEGALVRYFEPGALPSSVPGVTGVRVFVLGPPRDRKLLRRSDPSKRQSEVYELGGDDGADVGFLAAVESLDGAADGRQPFDKWFEMTAADLEAEHAFAERYWAEPEKWRQIEHDWMAAAGRLALQLDSDTNNTCLVLALELGSNGRVLLFPGDAQVGNWLSWDGLEWNIGEGQHITKVTAADLLARTVLYKVGHHGSHNATLREKGLELMSSHELAAMIPVSRSMAKKMAWNMPFPTLLRRLQQKTSGRILDRDTGVSSDNPGPLTKREWAEFVNRTDVQEYWIDYHVPLERTIGG